MGDFEKKKAIGIGSVVAVILGITAFLANLSEIAQFFDKKESNKENSVSVVETTKEKSVSEPTEENIPTPAEEIQPTEPQQKFIYLKNMKATEAHDLDQNASSTQDTIGNTYVGNFMILGSGYDDESSVTYYLGGKYKTLTGTLAVQDGTDDGYTGQIFISADDNIIYTTEPLGRVSVPSEIALNVENCQWLKISKAGYTFNGHGAWFILSDFKLE